MDEVRGLTKPMRRVQSRLGRPLAEVIRELYHDQGMTQAEVGAAIAREAGVTPLAASTVMRWMDRLGIDPRMPGQRPPAAVA
jgi:transposase